MHFGLYLKSKGVISAEQLVEALEVQLKTLVPIGQLALEESMLSARQIFEILRAQSDSPNERFGDLAVEMRFMSRDDVVRLLMIQADRKRAVSDILVEQGALSKHEMTTEMAAYRQSLIRPQRGTTVSRIVPAPRHSEAARSAIDTIVTV